MNDSRIDELLRLITKAELQATFRRTPGTGLPPCMVIVHTRDGANVAEFCGHDSIDALRGAVDQLLRKGAQ